jgi:class 3 adenylate cyclase
MTGRVDEAVLDRARDAVDRSAWDEATSEGADWTEMEVHGAARIGALAEGDEIWVSANTAEGSGFDVSAPRSVSLKGGPVEVVAVRWR